MAKNRTEKSKYQSPYSPGKYITAAQYIIERICEKKAVQGQTDLPDQFWSLPEWQQFWKMQLRRCHALLKKYDEQAIIQALRDDRTKTVYSLFAPWLEPVIVEYQNKLEAAKKKQESQPKLVTYTETPKQRTRFKRKSTGIIGKLMELDDGEEESSEES